MNTVKTKRISEQEFLADIKSIFGLYEPPFDDIDDDLLILSFTPYCDSGLIRKSTAKRISEKYQTCDFQTLEFYGDKILYDVMTTVLYGVFGLNNTPFFLNKVMSFLTRNRTLTDIMLDKGACEYIRGKNYPLSRPNTNFHNYCADALESLIGALFVHLNNLGYDHTLYITSWILKNTPILFLLREFLLSEGMDNTTIYSPSDRQRNLERLISKRQRILSESLNSPELSIILQDMLDERDFSDYAAIVDEQSSLRDIYKILGWEYKPPEYNETFSLYFVYGYPKGQEKIIGQGNTEREAIQDAKDYLVNMGYIINMINPKRYFR